jgi:cobalt-zinc-cadmium efflux system protein
LSGHSHSHHGVRPVGSKLKIGIILTGLILVVELVGGLFANSLALLGDAGHVFADVVALSLSWYGVRQAERPSSGGMTFGYHRVGVIVAVVNAISIFAIASVIFYEAYRRLQDPPEVTSSIMLGAAVVGLGVNIFIASWLHREQRANLNVRSAYWHALGDALASIGVIVGGIIILVAGWYLADPIISVFIALIIVAAAWRILRDGMRVLLEATPPHVDTSELVQELLQLPGVKDVHDVHVWSISSEIHSMSCHVLIDDLPTSEAAQMLRHQFDINHVTLQMECEQCDVDDVFCTLKFAPRHEEDSQSGEE